MAEINFDLFAPPLTEQLRGQLPHRVLKDTQNTVDAIKHLRIRGFLSATETRRACRRLNYAIGRRIRRRERSKQGKR